MKRLRELDFLRGIAVILVLLRHHWVGINGLQNIGWVGVDLFFVLSGFLVSGLLFAEYKKFGNTRPFYFLIRRGFKIYPMFYVSLILTAIASCFVALPELQNLNIKGQAVVWSSEILFLQNYVAAIWGHHWSLAIEEHFYLLIAAVFPFLIRYMRFAPVVFVVCMILRIITALYGPPHWFAETHLRLDSLFMGVCISYVYHFKDLRRFYERYRPLLIALSFIPLLFAFNEFSAVSFFTETIGFLLLSMSFASLLIVFLYADVSRFMWKPITTIGFYSYGIYLFHLYLIRFVVGDTYLFETPHEFTWFTVPSFLIFFFGGIGFGIGMSYLIERPFLAMRDKWFPRRVQII